MSKALAMADPITLAPFMQTLLLAVENSMDIQICPPLGKANMLQNLQKERPRHRVKCMRGVNLQNKLAFLQT
jgi:hypothetical protein